MRVIQMEQTARCSDCKHYYALTEKTGACLLKFTIRHSNWHCPSFEKGECNATLEDIIDFYHKFNEAVKIFIEARENLRKIIMDKVDGKRTIGDFIVTVKEVTQKRLDVNKVKKYLRDNGKLDEFLVESKHKMLIVKKL